MEYFVSVDVIRKLPEGCRLCESQGCATMSKPSVLEILFLGLLKVNSCCLASPRTNCMATTVGVEYASIAVSHLVVEHRGR